MYFTKYPHRSNFSFAEVLDEAKPQITIGKRQFEVGLTQYEGDIAHIRISNSAVWGGNKCLEALSIPTVSSTDRVVIGKDVRITVFGKGGNVLLKGSFGVSGESSMFAFEVNRGAKFFGMGEKNFGRLELSGLRTKFWNTDVWGDFHSAHFGEHPVDPPYLSIPYLIVKSGDEYVGLLLHNPYPCFMETPGTDEARAFHEWQQMSQDLILGAEGGEPNLWVIYGPTLRELTRKLQHLVGVTPLPPAWSLGYHQSRWGYGGHDDLLELDAKFAQNKIPCDSLWLDLDYMDGYRIFKTSERMFPEGVEATAAKLAKNGRRIVPILDPGVKFEQGYSVYDDGHTHRVFCLNGEGSEFVGMVWPGETVFPDFTQPKPRSWWADYVRAFAESGFAASWLDMNDPSTGPVDPQGMLFNGGKESHAAYHNQYALGMQIASKEGFLKARPNERPFLLSRSGFIGTSKSAAIWTGDNLSNYFYLKSTIPTSVNLSLSGVPFNGPDIGGFGASVSDELMVDWVKANFLFPFFRNHCANGERSQEPFAFPEATMAVLRRYIRLRYKLIPYLYNLFIEQEESGDPILRPLLYEYEDAGLAGADDEFMVGSWILQAPFLEDKQKARTVSLPGTEPWYDATSGDWVVPGEVIVKNEKVATPLFVRAGAVVPMQAGTPVDNHKELRSVHFHTFVPSGWSGESEYRYKVDDGISFAYRDGERSAAEIRLACADGNLAINFLQTESGFGPIQPTFVIHGAPKSVRLNGGEVKLASAKVVLTGKSLKVWIVKPV
jgi:alpha-glucosidase